MRLCWYVGERYVRDLKAKEEFAPRVLESIAALAGFLVSEVRIIERGTDQAKRESREQVPAERVKDAAAMARELRWRARIAAGYRSDDESDDGVATNGLTLNGVRSKRKRLEVQHAEGGHPLFRNFKPRAWENVVETAIESNTHALTVRRLPENEDLKEGWMDWKDEFIEEEEGQPVDVNRRRHVSVKVRRTLGGVERQRVERVIEDWVWKS